MLGYNCHTKFSCFPRRPLCVSHLRRVARIFLGQGIFLELGHLNKHSPTTQEEKPRGENVTDFFAWKLLKIAF